MEEFKTISKNAEAQIEVKKSKFIASVFYVESVEEIENILKDVRKKYYGARHNCYAYRIVEKDGGQESIKEKFSDDGEPSGTAGAPMLNILKKNELLNVLVIVTRYFGGILLGTGGLVRAYSDSLTLGLEEATIIGQELGEEIEIVVEYKDLEKLKYYCNKNEIEISDITYEDNVNCILKMNSQKKEKILSENQKEINIIKHTVLRKSYIRKNI